VIIPSSINIDAKLIEELKNTFIKFENNVNNVCIVFCERESYILRKTGKKIFHIMILPEETLFTLSYLRPLIDKWLKQSIQLFGENKLYQIKPKMDCNLEKVLWSSHYGIAYNLFDLIDNALEYGIKELPKAYMYNRMFYSAESYLIHKTGLKIYDRSDILDYIEEICLKKLEIGYNEILWLKQRSLLEFYANDKIFNIVIQSLYYFITHIL